MQVVHLLLYELNTRVWWEWVESKSNWSDGASRLFLGCPWAAKHGFALRELPQPMVYGEDLEKFLPMLLLVDGIGGTAAVAIQRLIAALGVSG